MYIRIKVSDDGMEALPPGTQLGSLELTLRLWGGGMLAREMTKAGEAEAAQGNAFETSLSCVCVCVCVCVYRHAPW